MDPHIPFPHPVFFAPHMMINHHHLRPQTPPNEDIKRTFTPMTTSPGQSAEASPDTSSSPLDTMELLLSVREVLSTLRLDSVGEVVSSGGMIVDPEAENMETEDVLH